MANRVSVALGKTVAPRRRRIAFADALARLGYIAAVAITRSAHLDLLQQACITLLPFSTRLETA